MSDDRLLFPALDTYQNKVTADQYHVTITITGQRLQLTVDQVLMFLIGLQAQARF